MTDKLFLTIAFPTYQDFAGIWASVGSLFLYHQDAMPACEVLIVDNSPQPDESAKALCTWKGCAPRRYVHDAVVVGTAAAKDACVRHAHGEYVLTMDSHVMLDAGALARLIDSLKGLPPAGYTNRPSVDDFFTGPLLYDDFTSVSTHFADKWRGEMLGTWDTDTRGTDPAAYPFEIGANGNGLFVVRRDSYLGMNPYFRGFGGEEWYIHEKYRRAGRKVWCLPFLRWYHRFGGPKVYRPALYDKVRNAVLAHLDLGLTLDRIYNHFVKELGKVSDEQWFALLADPYAHNPAVFADPAQSKPKAAKTCSTCQGQTAAIKPTENAFVVYQNGTRMDLTRQGFYELVVKGDTPTAKCMPTVKDYCHDQDEILMIGTGADQETCLLLLAALEAQPKRIRFYDTRPLPMLDLLRSQRGHTHLERLDTFPTRDQLQEADLVVIWQPYGQLGTPEFPNPRETHHGLELLLLDPNLNTPDNPIRNVLHTDRDWIVAGASRFHAHLTDDADLRKPLPSGPTQIKNYLTTMGKHLLAGAGKATPEVLEQRLLICDLCPERSGEHCSACGCPLAAKAALSTPSCPKYKWPGQTVPPEAPTNA